MAVRIRVLGNISIHDGSVEFPIRGLLKRRLIGALALRCGETVSAETLIDAMWGERPPATARQSLHVHLSHLRTQLRDAAVHDPIETAAAGYRLAPGVGTDADRFGALIDAATRAANRGDLRHALADLREALASWGEPYVDLHDDLACVAEQARLRILHDDAIDRFHEITLALDEPDAIASLTATVASRPLRERPYVQLAMTYIDHGDHAAAEQVTEQLATMLADEFGVATNPNVEQLRVAAAAPRANRSRPEPEPDPLSELLRTTAAVTIVDTSSMTDPASTIDRFVRAHDRQATPIAHVVVPPGVFDPTVPLLDVDPSLLRSGVPHRQARFEAAATQMDEAVGTNGVVVIEGLERASSLLIDFLTYVQQRRPNGTRILGVAGAELGPRFARLVAVAGPARAATTGEVSAGRRRKTASERLLLAALGACILPCPAEAVLRSVDLDPVELRSALELLIGDGSVRQEPGGRLGLRTRTSDAEIGPEFHHRMPVELERLGIDPDYVDAASLHHHLAAGRGLTEAMERRAIRVATRMEQLGAVREIVDLLVPAVASNAGLEIRTILGRAQIRAGDLEDGAATLDVVIEEAEASGAAEVMAEAVRARREIRAPQTTDEDERALLNRTLHRLEGSASETRFQLLTDLANSYFLTDPDQALARSTDTLELARRVGDDRSVARALTGLAQAQMRPGRAETRLAIALEAQEFARRCDLVETLVLALTYEAGALMELGRLRRASPPLQYATALAADVQVPRFAWWAATWTALLSFATEGDSGADQRFQEAYELWPSATRADALDCYMTQIASLYFYRGEGGALAEALVDLAARSGSGRGAAALAFAQGGELDRAREQLAIVLAPGYIESVRTIARAPLIAAAAEAALLCDVSDAGSILQPEARSLADTHVVLNTWGGGGYYWGSMRHILAITHELVGDHEAAVREYQMAASQQADAGGTTFARRSEAAAARVAG